MIKNLENYITEQVKVYLKEEGIKDLDETTLKQSIKTACDEMKYSLMYSTISKYFIVLGDLDKAKKYNDEYEKENARIFKKLEATITPKKKFVIYRRRFS